MVVGLARIRPEIEKLVVIGSMRRHALLSSPRAWLKGGRVCPLDELPVALPDGVDAVGRLQDHVVSQGWSRFRLNERS